MRDAEVEHLHDLDWAHVAALPRDEDVLRLEIAMDDSGLMRGHQRRADGQDEVDEGRGAKAHHALKALAQVFALKQLHHEVGHAVGDADIADVDRMRMAHAPGGLGLTNKARR